MRSCSSIVAALAALKGVLAGGELDVAELGVPGGHDERCRGEVR
jgi:hypothetical protein